MQSVLSGMLSQLNPQVVYIVVGVLVVSAILALIKKAIKITIIVAAMAFLIFSLAPMAKNVQNNYKFNIDNGVATIQIHQNTLKLDKKSIESVELRHKGSAGYTINVKYKDGLGSVTVPPFMVGLVREYLDKNEIPTVIIE